MSGAPVTDWRDYDTAYTERYMKLPDKEYCKRGYDRGSILSHVRCFPDDENRLLLVHGLIDENVHFTHTAKLTNELNKQGKHYNVQVECFDSLYEISKRLTVVVSAKLIVSVKQIS